MPPTTDTERRLRRELPGARTHHGLLTAAAIVIAAAVVAQAVLLAVVLAGAFTGDLSGDRIAVLLIALVGAVAVRAGVSWGRTVYAQRVSAAVKAELRRRVLARAAARGPLALAGDAHPAPATLVSGLDALDAYFTSSRPTMLAAKVTPPVVIAALAVVDPTSAVVVLVTLPLIPIFGALVGAHTRSRTARQWAALSRLGGHFLDVTAGLPTLKAFGRGRHQVAVVARMADAHRATTVATLKVAFLSALVLELVATLSVALVAVPVGLRLLSGGAVLSTALVVLFLAPEAFLPLRAAGTAFHDSAAGLSVASSVFAWLDDGPDVDGPAAGRPARVTDRDPVPVDATPPAVLALDRVSVRYPGRDTTALSGASLTVTRGERVALVGPSGSGKSTVLALLLGFTDPAGGRVLVEQRDRLVDLAGADHDVWRTQIAWVPQRPHLFATSVADNIRLGRPDAPLDRIREAARSAAADDFVRDLPDGYDTVLGDRGAGLSAGQAQRIALARAFLRDAPLLLLDEPTAHLDRGSEQVALEATERLMAGRTTLVVAHRPTILPLVGRVVRIDAGHLTEQLPERAA